MREPPAPHRQWVAVYATHPLSTPARIMGHLKFGQGASLSGMEQSQPLLLNLVQDGLVTGSVGRGLQRIHVIQDQVVLLDVDTVMRKNDQK